MTTLFLALVATVLGEGDFSTGAAVLDIQRRLPSVVSTEQRRRFEVTAFCNTLTLFDTDCGHESTLRCPAGMSEYDRGHHGVGCGTWLLPEYHYKQCTNNGIKDCQVWAKDKVNTEGGHGEICIDGHTRRFIVAVGGQALPFGDPNEYSKPCGEVGMNGPCAGLMICKVPTDCHAWIKKIAQNNPRGTFGKVCFERDQWNWSHHNDGSISTTRSIGN